MRALLQLADVYLEHGRMKRTMGDGGEDEINQAIALFAEVIEFRTEVIGAASADEARSRLEVGKSLLMPPEDKYACFL
jgi:hypothetical protein